MPRVPAQIQPLVAQLWVVGNQNLCCIGSRNDPKGFKAVLPNPNVWILTETYKTTTTTDSSFAFTLERRLSGTEINNEIENKLGIELEMLEAHLIRLISTVIK